MSGSSDKHNWLSHPMVNVIVGFLLTGVIGTIITQYFFARRQQEQLLAQQLQHRKEIIQLLSERIVEFEMRAKFLIDNLQEEAPKEEIAQLKQAYASAGNPIQATEILQACDIDGQLQKLSRCSGIVAEQLHELIRKTVGFGDRAGTERRAELERQVEQQCS